MNLFIIGAGFTKALFPRAPLNCDLLGALSSESRNSAAPALRDRYGSTDIEIVLTKLDADLAMSAGKLDALTDDLRDWRERINFELASYFAAYSVSEELMAESPWLSDLIDGAFSPGDVAISLNYDCALEGALDAREKWSANGGYGTALNNPLVRDRPPSPIEVLKIHGSASFKIVPDPAEPTVNTVSFEVNGHFFPRSEKYTHFGYGGGTGKRYVIAPSYVKIPTIEVAYLMLDALKASTKADRLIIIGSALRPEDGFLTMLATNFLRQPSSRARKIVIVDPSAARIASRLSEFWGGNVTSEILPIQDQLQASVPRLLEAIAR